MNAISPASNSPESWENAKAYASLIGEAPPAFAVLVKGILQDLSKGNSSEISFINRSQLQRLLRSENFRAAYYYAAKFAYPERLEGKDLSNLRRLSEFYSPHDMCFLLPIIFYFRRFNQKLHTDEWNEFKREMHRFMHVGMLVGRSLENVGVGCGAFASAARYLGATCFLMHDADGFIRYRNKAQTMKRAFITEYEEDRWGCTSLQNFSYLAQQFGFGRKFSEGFVRSVDQGVPAKEISERLWYRFRVTIDWSESLESIGGIPDTTHRGDFYPYEEPMARLKEDMANIDGLLGGTPWLERTGDDLSPETTPELFGAGSGKESAASSQPDAEEPPQEEAQSGEEPSSEEEASLDEIFDAEE